MWTVSNILNVTAAVSVGLAATWGKPMINKRWRSSTNKWVSNLQPLLRCFWKSPWQRKTSWDHKFFFLYRMFIGFKEQIAGTPGFHWKHQGFLYDFPFNQPNDIFIWSRSHVDFMKFHSNRFDKGCEILESTSCFPLARRRDCQKSLSQNPWFGRVDPIICWCPRDVWWTLILAYIGICGMYYIFLSDGHDGGPR